MATLHSSKVEQRKLNSEKLLRPWLRMGLHLMMSMYMLYMSKYMEPLTGHENPTRRQLRARAKKQARAELCQAQHS